MCFLSSIFPGPFLLAAPSYSLCNDHLLVLFLYPPLLLLFFLFLPVLHFPSSSCSSSFSSPALSPASLTLTIQTSNEPVQSVSVRTNSRSISFHHISDRRRADQRRGPRPPRPRDGPATDHHLKTKGLCHISVDNPHGRTSVRTGGQRDRARRSCERDDGGGTGRSIMSLPSNPFDVQGGRTGAGSYSITIPIGPSRRYALIVQRTRFVTDGGLVKTIPDAVIAFTYRWSRRRKQIAGGPD